MWSHLATFRVTGVTTAIRRQCFRVKVPILLDIESPMRAFVTMGPVITVAVDLHFAYAGFTIEMAHHILTLLRWIGKQGERI